jgi:hypothetical protein
LTNDYLLFDKQTLISGIWILFMAKNLQPLLVLRDRASIEVKNGQNLSQKPGETENFLSKNVVFLKNPAGSQKIKA